VHTARSYGGELAPAQIAAAARESGLDFIVITEHNTADTHDAWSQLADNELLVILGQEVTTHTGHWLALGIRPEQVIEWRYGVRDGVVGRYVNQVREVGGLCVAAHPYAPYPGGVFMYPFDAFDAVEVWNGRWASDLPWNADNDAVLAEWGVLWPRASAGGAGCRRSVTAIPIWKARSACHTPLCWPMS
jgi:predicted metal-dependent phosphoesterase TrpH